LRGDKVKKLMMLAAMLALVLVVAAPAIGQVQHAIGQESETGTVNATFTANQSGSNSSQCVTPLQFGNTGSLQNGQSVLQYASDSGDIEFEGPTFEFTPTLNATCNQAVQQSSAASG
jgi:spore coat protein U-like protein